MQKKFLVWIALGAGLVAVVSMLAVAVVLAAGPSLQPKGSMRMTAVSASNTVTNKGTQFKDIPNLVAQVPVPDGKLADVIIEFSGVTNSQDHLYLQAKVDDSSMFPAGQLVSGGASIQSFNFYRFDLTPGTHTFSIQWHGEGQTQTISTRSMIVLVNLHDIPTPTPAP